MSRSCIEYFHMTECVLLLAFVAVLLLGWVHMTVVLGDHIRDIVIQACGLTRVADRSAVWRRT